ncbi:MAG TPA: hypothetical protein VGS12_04465 [Caulobacteraceae bacterium]|nr:hypothetical protein [Caulobacteraceae bacterium]
MAHVDIAAVVGAGVRLVFRRPLSVIVWGLLPTAYVAALLAVYGGPIAACISALAGGAADVPGAALALAGNFLGLFALLALGLTLISAVLVSAVIRAELEPQERGFASLRFGAEEMWVLAAMIILGLVIVAIAVALAIPLGLFAFAAALGGMWGGYLHGPAGFRLIPGLIGARLLVQLIIQGVVLWIWSRLAPGVVMSRDQRQFRLFESWSLTRGQGWPMFLSMLLVWLIVFAVDFVVMCIAAAAVFGAVLAIPGIGQPSAFFARPAADWIGSFAPAAVILAVALVVVSGIGMALKWGALAEAYRQLRAGPAGGEAAA